MAQAQQAAEQGEQAEQRTDDKHTEHHDNQRQLNGLVGQIAERYAVEIDQRDDYEKNQDDGFDNEIKQFHGVSLKSAGCLHTYRKCVSVNDLRGI